MQTCSSCGERLRPLFTSLFCPNECGNQNSRQRISTVEGNRWMIRLIYTETELIPALATHGHWLNSVTDKTILSEIPDKKIFASIHWNPLHYPHEFQLLPDKTAFRCIRKSLVCPRGAAILRWRI